MHLGTLGRIEGAKCLVARCEQRGGRPAFHDFYKVGGLTRFVFAFQEISSHFGKFGIQIGSASIDIPTMQKYKDKIVTGLTQGIEGLFKRNKVEYVKVRLYQLHHPFQTRFHHALGL